MESANQVASVSYALRESDEQHLRELVEAGRIDDATRGYCRYTRQSYSAAVLWVNRVAGTIASTAGLHATVAGRVPPALTDG